MLTSSIGIGLAFISMLAWGLGDFTIQKSAKKLGDWETLFFIDLIGMIMLIPFVWKGLIGLISDPTVDVLILVSTGLVLLVSALFDLEGYKQGKLSILEPLLSMEILAASLLSLFILHDTMTGYQVALILTLVIGLILVSFKEKTFSHKMLLEKGVAIFLVGATIMGVVDFLLAWGSRVTDPLLANFVIDFVITVISGAVLISTGRAKRAFRDVRSSRGLILAMSIADNIGWIGYAVAMVLVPVGVATGISESSTIIAVLLGLFINKEKLQRHQKVGLVIALVSVITLATITAK
jgi:drug/metabolite transporter (DMT)-like permease